VYPVPLRHSYFLGVHSTITLDGYIKIGPTATPAFNIENYKGLENVTLYDFINTSLKYLKFVKSE
jgi:L-2-hydroxyglutarate oxidase